MKLFTIITLSLLALTAQADTTLTGTVGPLESNQDLMIENGYDGLGEKGSVIAMGFQAGAGDLIRIDVTPINPVNWPFNGIVIEEESVNVAYCKLYDFWDVENVIWHGDNREEVLVDIPYSTLWTFDCEWLAGNGQYVMMSASLVSN